MTHSSIFYIHTRRPLVLSTVNARKRHTERESIFTFSTRTTNNHHRTRTNPTPKATTKTSPLSRQSAQIHQLMRSPGAPAPSAPQSNAHRAPPSQLIAPVPSLGRTRIESTKLLKHIIPEKLSARIYIYVYRHAGKAGRSRGIDRAGTCARVSGARARARERDKTAARARGDLSRCHGHAGAS